MTTTYDDYHRALTELQGLPDRVAADLEEAATAFAHANGLADRAVAAAERVTADSVKAIEAQLAAARSALEPLDKSNLVPPQIRPTGGVKAATRDDIAKAQKDLAAAVNRVRQAVQSEIQRINAENDRLAREAAERERLAREAAQRALAAAARRKKLLQLGTAIICVVALLIVILVVAL